MKYAILIWMSESEKLVGTGSVYGWYESLGTALNTVVDMRRDNRYWDIQVLKVI